MAHFAKLGIGNVIEQIVVVHNSVITDNNGNEVEQLGVDFLNKIYNTRDVWKQSSYNKSFRGNFAIIGGTYDQQKDVFLPPKRNESWVLDEETLSWKAPIPYPTDGNDYVWNEATLSWRIIVVGPSTEV
jgi:hypothetical protein